MLCVSTYFDDFIILCVPSLAITRETVNYVGLSRGILPSLRTGCCPKLLSSLIRPQSPPVLHLFHDMGMPFFPKETFINLCICFRGCQGAVTPALWSAGAREFSWGRCQGCLLILRADLSSSTADPASGTTGESLGHGLSLSRILHYIRGLKAT